MNRQTIGAIMAGGRGSRMQSVVKSKALARVGSRPLIAHVMSQLAAAGVTQVLVDAPEGDRSFTAEVLDLRPEGLDLRFIKSDASDGTRGAVRRILQACDGTECLLSTVDTIAPSGAYRALRVAAERCESEVAVMILATTVIHDETPIWVHVADDGATVLEFGKEVDRSNRCFGNVRWFSPKGTAAYLSIPESASLRDTGVMRAVVHELAGKVRQLTIDPVFDVDTPEDLKMAAAWLRGERDL